MRPITRRLRFFAAVLGLAQCAVPALALAHELSAAGYGAPVSHAESQGTSHDVASHAHECGLCRNVASKGRMPAAEHSGLAQGRASLRGSWDARTTVPRGNDGCAALPRGPPVG